MSGTHLVHLMPRSASLEQAGGLHRMTLRGHNGPVLKVVLSPNGRDVITVSADGTAQVCTGLRDLEPARFAVWAPGLLRAEGQ